MSPGDGLWLHGGRAHDVTFSKSGVHEGLGVDFVEKSRIDWRLSMLAGNDDQYFVVVRFCLELRDDLAKGRVDKVEGLDDC